LVISQTKPLFSGVARIAERMEIGLRDLGCEVDVYSPQPFSQVSWGEYRLKNSLPLFNKMLEQKPYDIINIHGPVPTFSDVILILCRVNNRRLEGAKLVYTHHWDIDVSKITAPLEWVYNRVTRSIIRLADVIIVSSQSYYDDLVRFVHSTKIRNIPWGVDDKFLCPNIPRKSEKFTILYVGQLRPYKGIDILLRASVYLKECDVIIVGGGHRRDEYDQLVKTLNLQNVTIKGQVTDQDLRQLYASSHVIVLPSVSRLEAFGIVLLEGMGAGCVPVASNLPGVIDTIGNAGMIFLTSNIESLVHTLERLRKDHVLFQQLSRAAHNRARMFSWEATCRGYLDAFSIVDGRG
jgi:glycosyltransferase involved in cell wall biosynthesis